MRVYIILVALFGLLVGDASAISWNEYKLKFGKHYESPLEDTIRQVIFQRNLAHIEHHNFRANGNSFEMGLSHLTDLSHGEYLKLNGLKPRLDGAPKKEPSKFLLDLLSGDDTMPDSVDYRNQTGRVGPVKNQGHCGSCWAFATTGLLEGQEHKKWIRRLKGDAVVPLSEQDLVDCDTFSGGCNGGDVDNAIDYIMSAGGLETERDYPYKSGANQSEQACAHQAQLAFESTRFLQGYDQLDQGDEEMLKRVVAKYGPVAVSMDASQPSFHHYKSGVYFDEACGNQPGQMDHAVLVVGYGSCAEQGDYWLVKNSWSADWGESGYFKLARNRGNHCGVATAPIIVH